jgi:hypothetical protein
MEERGSMPAIVISQYQKKIDASPTHAAALDALGRQHAIRKAKEHRKSGKLESGYFNIFLIDMPFRDVPDDLATTEVDELTLDGET